MAGSEDRGPSDEDSEWSDFSSNSSTKNTLNITPSGLRTLDPISVLSTLLSCFPRQSDATPFGVSDEGSNRSVSNDRS